MMTLDDGTKLLAEHIVSLETKGTFRTRPVFKHHQSMSMEALEDLENSLGVAIPSVIKTWLYVAGEGDLNDVLAFRYEFLSVVQLGGVGQCLVFAQDDLGCFYAHHESTSRIFYIARSEVFHSLIAVNFCTFLREFERRKFKLDEWRDSMHLGNVGE